MLSTEQCKKYLKGADYTIEQIERIKDSLYQAAEILVAQYINDRNNDKQKTN